MEHESEPVEEQSTIDVRVFALVRAVPAGHVASYGQVGAACDPPVSGYICGRIMGRCGDDVPWWRIVGKEGNLPVRKRSPEQEDRQRDALEAEGVGFLEDGRVDMVRYAWDFGSQSALW